MTRLAPLLLATFLLASCAKELVCPAGQTDCSGSCVSLLTDARNCGACGNAVGPLEVCSAGAPACDPGVAICGSACTDLARDAANCGACGNACAPADFCTTAGGATSCTASCPTGFTACGRACVDPLSDRFNCGACGNACAAGETCRAGACRADLEVACYATNEVVPVAADLSPAGASWILPAQPTALAIMGGAVYSANGWPASLSVLPLDSALPPSHTSLAGNDLEAIVAHDNVLLVANAGIGSLVVASPSGAVLDEIAMPRQQSGPNPRSIAVVGSTAYLPLYGNGTDATSGQSVAKVDLSALGACVAGTAGSCGAVLGEIDLLSVAGASDAPGLPFPSAALAVGGSVYVTLANLAQDTISCGTGCSYTGYVKPAGDGKLAVVNPAAGDAVSVVNLTGCGNPGALALLGSTLWVSCGSGSYPALAPSALVPVDLAVSPPAAGAALPLSGIVPGALAFCGGVGYVTDQWSGAVVRFDPATRTVEAPVTVCPTAAAGWAWAADVACSG